jgi:hypothetical protein
MRLGDAPFHHGVLADGTVLDVLIGPAGAGFGLPAVEPLAPPPPVPLAEGAALDFWLNSMKHAKPFGRGVGGIVFFGLHHDAMALMRLWAMEDSGKDPGSGSFTIFGMTPLVRKHLTPGRLKLLGMPTGTIEELRAAARAYREAASIAGRAAEAKWGVPYAHRLEEVVRERWPV